MSLCSSKFPLYPANKVPGLALATQGALNRESIYATVIQSSSSTTNTSVPKTMAKKTAPRTFDDVLSLLGGQRFDVAPAHDGSKRTPAGFMVSKYGCAAEIAAGPTGSDSAVLMLARPRLAAQRRNLPHRRQGLPEVSQDQQAGDSRHRRPSSIAPRLYGGAERGDRPDDTL